MQITLRIDWQSLIEPLPFEKEQARYHYILGNPPFLGKQYQNEEQKKDMDSIFTGVNGAGVLDYVTAWYIRAAQYLQTANAVEEKALPKTRAAFVSTNSISQGEQVAILWNELFNKYHVKIHFAHRTFKWSNEARGNAAVHVVIIGFSNHDTTEKILYEYENISGEPHEVKARNINPYLVPADDLLVSKTRKPLCAVPEMNYGSMPNDGGFLLLDKEAKDELIRSYPQSKKFVKKFVMGEELINNIPRYCLWLVDAEPSEIKSIPPIVERIEHVKQTRQKSTRPKTKELALVPALFGELRQPTKKYIALPRVSSVNRTYIPIDILPPSTIAGDKVYTVETDSLFCFGVLTSLMHMVWMKYTAGRLKSDYSYTNSITYNNYPWPEAPTEKQKDAVEKAAQGILDARAQFPDSSLADLYNPNTMPPALVKAHQALDKAVDSCYRSQPFTNETKRIEFLFELYDKYTAGLFATDKKGKKKKA